MTRIDSPSIQVYEWFQRQGYSDREANDLHNQVEDAPDPAAELARLKPAAIQHRHEKTLDKIKSYGLYAGLTGVGAAVLMPSDRLSQIRSDASALRRVGTAYEHVGARLGVGALAAGAFMGTATLARGTYDQLHGASVPAAGILAAGATVGAASALELVGKRANPAIQFAGRGARLPLLVAGGMAGLEAPFLASRNLDPDSKHDLPIGLTSIGVGVAGLYGSVMHAPNRTVAAAGIGAGIGMMLYGATIATQAVDERLSDR